MIIMAAIEVIMYFSKQYIELEWEWNQSQISGIIINYWETQLAFHFMLLLYNITRGIFIDLDDTYSLN